MFKEFSVEKIVMGPIGMGDDLYKTVERYAAENHITHAWINALGAVTQLAYFYYDQDKKEYAQESVHEKLEILSCIGNISLKNGKPFLHLHITCSDRKGKTIGGHLTPGALVFACEIILFVLKGSEKLERGFDPVTGLHLWQCGLHDDKK